MKCASTLFLFLAWSIVAVSQTINYKNEFGFRSDNDAYLATRQDRYYTNGIFLNFRHAADQKKISSNLDKKIWDAEIGQKMYNPQTGHITDIIYVDRPFAAYLFAGTGLNWFFKNEKSLKANFQAGVIGPQALGEQAQKLLHNSVGFYPIEGWEFQVNNEFEINSSASFSSLLVRNSKNNADLAFNSYLNAGTTFSGAGAGATFRFGKINNLFNSAITNSRISNSATDSIPGGEFFFYARPMLHIVAYDASISGGMFREDKGPVVFNSKPIVLSQEFGITYAKGKWTTDFSVIFKTKEVKSFARPHQYGSISLFYRY